MLLRSRLVLRLGRTGLPTRLPACCPVGSAPLNTVNGTPLCHVPSVLICHPPKSLPRKPCWLFITGSSHTKLTVKRCGRSYVEGANSPASIAEGSCGVATSPAEGLNVSEPSSLKLLQV